MKKKTMMMVGLLIFSGVSFAAAEAREDAELYEWKNGDGMNGVFPHITVMAPGAGSDSEAGVGAMIPWADRLWVIGYVAHIRGENLGLFELKEDMSWRRHPASVTGTFANRFIHWESKQAIIGPHLIDEKGKVRTIEQLSKHRLTATCYHLEKPQAMVYFLTMEGLLFEVNVNTLEVKQLGDLTKKLYVEGIWPHWKGMWSAQGKLVVANNSYGEGEHMGKRHAGRLAEWDGEGEWKILEKNPFVEVSGQTRRGKYGGALFATGWDERSVIMRVLSNGKWKRYRLPKGNHTYDHGWNTEWMRIREAQTERYLMDVFGIFYEMPAIVYDNSVWGVKPICSHLRLIPDFCSWRGFFVMGSDQTEHNVGQPQSGLYFGNIDDLWQMGKPTGWGAVWRKTEIEAGETSDPFLMTGFDKKVLHLAVESEDPMTITVEVDFLGDGMWKEYETFNLEPGGYVHHEFPDAFSAHWVRLKTDGDCKATAQFMYN
ncbi:hypothetical protein STSP2_02216 [Anaerohalosphaera lusitana]|uniref:Arylsulfotransferase (ASST) n=1 Tax=Anaerohalosphaera lusitana TaxID=1936003 RepID=A0A1U9NMH1_9BACT|nr:hypothetical protein [Anaerohalosphaera lusitana]AQT69035.1 hypothetical protein STSP2_02216 [Anaerohalosphaera lusitana]